MARWRSWKVSKVTPPVLGPARVEAVMRRLLPLVLAIAALAAPSSAPTAAAAPLPPARHVFVIVLENHEFFDTFGPGGQVFAPYLNRTLVPSGQLLTQYYGVGHSSADNYIAMAGGQPPTPSGQDDCPDDPSNGAADPYAGVNTPKRVPRDAQQPYNIAVGDGCLYPDNFPTIGDQLTAAGYTWKSYNQDMPSPCYKLGSYNAGHPGDYRRKHNPFVLYESLINSGQCDANVVGLPSPEELATTLSSEAPAPNFTYIVPNQCEDGHDTCAKPVPGAGLDPVSGSEVQLTQIDAFLQRYVPPIVNSPVFQKDGLLVVTFDEAVENLSCCNEQPGPATDDPGNQAGIPGSGGGDSGAVLISPFIKPGGFNTTGYNHYSLLRSVEDLFGLPHLGYAAPPDLAPFGADVFTNPPAAAGGEPPAPEQQQLQQQERQQQRQTPVPEEAISAQSAPGPAATPSSA